MQKIDVKILDRIRENCESHKHYRVGILCENRERAKQIQDALVCSWPATGRQSGAGYFDVQFAVNYSFVRILTHQNLVTGCARGNKFHEIYMDCDMWELDEPDEFEFERMVVPYQHLDFRYTPYGIDREAFRHLDTLERYSWEDYQTPLEFEFTESTLEKLKKLATSYNLDAFRYLAKTEAPDLGEFTPSQELNNFLDSLT